jgi:hypothetical protein
LPAARRKIGIKLDGTLMVRQGCGGAFLVTSFFAKAKRFQCFQRRRGGLGAEVGYNPRYRGKRSYDPLLCVEANSSFLWDVELRRGDAGTWAGSEQLLACCFLSSPADIREFRVRADAGFGYGPVLDLLEMTAQYTVVARMIPSLKRELGRLTESQLGNRGI